MKKSMLLLVALFIFTSVNLKAQSPQKINFQSIVRNTSGVIVSNKSVNFKITILSGSTTGTPVYSETHLKTTDAIGLVSLQIGSGTVVSNGVFSSLNWGNASHFIKLEADFTGGNTYVTLGTQELMSVPYAMYASKTDTASLNLTNRFAEKAPINNPIFTGTVGGITKAMVGLSDVENTSDANKPVSTLTQAALETKFNKADFPRGSNRGEFLYWNDENWQSLEPGEPGQSIIMDSNRNPTWGCIVTNTVDMPSSTPTLLVNTALTEPITIATTGATGIDTIASGLPNGVTATRSANEITISGTPTAAGTFEYKILLTGGCGTAIATGTITVTCVTNNTAAAPSSSPTIEVNTVLTESITIATTEATGIDTTGSGLPNGVTATWSADVIAISGTPTAAGTFNYEILLTGGCGRVVATGSITVATVPGDVEDVVVTDGLEEGEVIVTFSAPISDGGSPIIEYEVEVTEEEVTDVNSPTISSYSQKNILIENSTITSNDIPLTMIEDTNEPVSGFVVSSITRTKGSKSPITVKGLKTSVSYIFKVFAKNLIGISPPPSSGKTKKFTLKVFFKCGNNTISDIENNTYNTVAIGTQCWMKENLRTRVYNDGTEIRFDNSGGPGGSTSQTWSGTGREYGAYTIYAHDSTTTTPSNLTSYGYLYNWYAVKGIASVGSTTYKIICPKGWHVPTDAEWTIMIQALDPSQVENNPTGAQSNTAATLMKENSSLWTTNTGTNTSGFSALPGGYRHQTGSFNSIGTNALFWCATANSTSPGKAWSRYLYNNGRLDRGTGDFYSFGASVRCLKDSL